MLLLILLINTLYNLPWISDKVIELFVSLEGILFFLLMIKLY